MRRKGSLGYRRVNNSRTPIQVKTDRTSKYVTYSFVIRNDRAGKGGFSNRLEPTELAVVAPVPAPREFVHRFTVSAPG